jgi:hypothetical protein
MFVCTGHAVAGPEHQHAAAYGEALLVQFITSLIMYQLPM